MSDLPELRPILLGVPGAIGGRQQPGGGIRQAFRRGRHPSRPVLSSVTGGTSAGGAVGEGEDEGEGARGGARQAEGAVEGGVRAVCGVRRGGLGQNRREVL